MNLQNMGYIFAGLQDYRWLHTYWIHFNIKVLFWNKYTPSTKILRHNIHRNGNELLITPIVNLISHVFIQNNEVNNQVSGSKPPAAFSLRFVSVLHNVNYCCILCGEQWKVVNGGDDCGAGGSVGSGGTGVWGPLGVLRVLGSNKKIPLWQHAHTVIKRHSTPFRHRGRWLRVSGKTMDEHTLAPSTFLFPFPFPFIFSLFFFFCPRLTQLVGEDLHPSIQPFVLMRKTESSMLYSILLDHDWIAWLGVATLIKLSRVN